MDDYTLMTTDSMALVLNDDGCCMRHPSIKLRQIDANGDVFLKETCPECQAEYSSTQNALLQKRRDIAAQLQALQGTTNGEEVEEAAQEDEEEDGASDVDSTNAAPPPPLDTSAPLSLESLGAHMMHIQQMQDILMFQKDKEVLELRQKVEQQQSLLTQKEVEIALLKERMQHQKEEMEKELKLIKRAVAMDRERRNVAPPQQTTTQQQDIHIQQLHVHKIPSETSSSPQQIHESAKQAVQSLVEDPSKSTSSSDRVVVVKGVGKAVASSTTSSDDNDNKATAITMAKAVATSSEKQEATMAAAISKQEQPPARIASRVESEGESQAQLGIAPKEEYDEEENQNVAKMPPPEDDDDDIEFIPKEQDANSAVAKQSSRGNVNVRAYAQKLEQEADSVEFVPDTVLRPAHFKPKPRDRQEWDIDYVPDSTTSKVKKSPPPAQLKQDEKEHDVSKVKKSPPAQLKQDDHDEQVKLFPARDSMLHLKQNGDDDDDDKSLEEPTVKTIPDDALAYVPDDVWQNVYKDDDEEDKVESEEEDDFDANAPMSEKPGELPILKKKSTPVPFKSKPGPLTTPKAPPEHANEHRKDPLEASMSSLKPPGGGNSNRLQAPSDALPTLKDLPEQFGKMAVGPVDEFAVDPNAPPMVPLEEQVTLGSEFNVSNRFTPNVVGPDDEDVTVGQSTIGPTVASSTYGEDRVKVKDHVLLDPYGDKGIYTGQVLLSTGLPHGYGLMVYEDDGRTYEGDWRHGRWNGWGRATFSNGDSFEGFYKYDQRHGHGKYSWKDGRIYEGDFVEDKRHGSGRFIWPDGAKYDGDFNNGQRHGRGSYIFADGGRYIGEWMNGRYEGYGECHWADGRVYKGEWKDGMADGEGVETYPDGRIRHSGKWIKDAPIRK